MILCAGGVAPGSPHPEGGAALGCRIGNRSGAALSYLIEHTLMASARFTYSEIDKIRIRETGRMRHERRDGSPL